MAGTPGNRTQLPVYGGDNGFEDRDASISSVYIEQGDTYYIRNIPEGKYYLRIFYGRDMLVKQVNDRCFHKFMTQPQFEETQALFDFNLIPVGGSDPYTGLYMNKYKVPKYEYRITARGKDFEFYEE